MNGNRFYGYLREKKCYDVREGMQCCGKRRCEGISMGISGNVRESLRKDSEWDIAGHT